jgi:hypothetical protein
MHASRSPRRRPARCGASLSLALVSAALLPAAASALTVSSVPLPADYFPRDVAPAADGTARVLLEQWGKRAEQREVVVGAEALIGAPLQLLAPSPTQGDFTLGSLTARGSVIAFRSNRPPHPKLRTVIWEDGKVVGKAQTISDPSRSFRGGWTTASPSGAAAVEFWQHLGSRRWESRLAIRPAGARRFLPAVAASPTGSPVRRGSGGGVQLWVTWGPNGDGAVLWPSGGEHGSSVLRRIARDGSIGPAIMLPDVELPIDGFSSIEVGAGGDIVIARQTRTEGPWVARGDGEDQRVTARAEVLTIPAGSDVAGAPVLLREESGWGEEVNGFSVGADVDASGHVIVAIAGGRNRIEVFEGGIAPGSLRSVGAFPNREWAGYGEFSVLHTTDGGAAAFWGAETMTMQRAAGGTWSAPEYILPKLKRGISVLESPRPAADGGVVGIVRRDTGDDDLWLRPALVRIHR